MTAVVTGPDTADPTDPVTEQPASTAGPTSAGPPGAENPDVRFEFLDPRVLLVDKNIRQAHLELDFLASVRDDGVLQPIVAYDTTDDSGAPAIRVRFGHRRVLAAIEGGRFAVPAMIHAGELDDQRAAEIERITQQYTENHHRDPLTDSDKVNAVDQLTLLGMSAGKIAGKVKIKRKDVLSAKKVAGSRRASDAVATKAMTLEQGAVLAEFDDDEEAAEHLLKVVERGGHGFEHHAQRMRDNRERRRQVEALTAQLAEQGITPVEAPSYDSRSSWVTNLRASSEPGAERLTDEGHTECPGHGIAIEDTSRTPQLRAVCSDPKAHGHHDPLRSGTSGGKWTEEQKAERAVVIARNKEWASAETVRRAHLTQFFAGRKTAPKGAAAFVAQIVLRHPDFLNDLARNRQVLTEFLGRPVKSDGLYDYAAAQEALRQVAAVLDGASDKHALALTLAMVCAAVEARTSKACWRGAREPFGLYLRFLSDSDIGYELSEVERLAIPTAERPDPVYDVDLDAEPGSAVPSEGGGERRDGEQGTDTGPQTGPQTGPAADGDDEHGSVVTVLDAGGAAQPADEATAGDGEPAAA